MCSQLNSKSTWKYIGTVAGKTDSIILPTGWKELKILIRNNTNYASFTPIRDMFDNTSETVLYLRNGFAYESSGAMFIVRVSKDTVSINAAATTNIATRVATDVASATRLYAWYR